MKRGYILLLPLLLVVGCQPEDAPEPVDAQGMYERAQALLKPNVEHDASDFSGAMEYLQKAAEAGLVRAQLDLGGIYFAGGKGVAADFQKAYNWFTLAATQGSREAEVFLGILQADGSLGKVDMAAALQHWRHAADAGIAEGQYRLGRELVKLDESRQEGMEYLEKASAMIPKAATALGNLYYSYLKDEKTSAAWYEKGALAGDPMAQHVFAEMLLLGEPVAQDAARGLAMLRMAAGQDYQPAMARLIKVLRSGKNAAENEKEAEAWSVRLQELRKAEKPGSQNTH